MRARAGDRRNGAAHHSTEIAETQPGRRPACLLSVEDLAAYLQVPIATIYQWRYKGDGPDAFRIGKHLRFDPTDVDRWLGERKVASPR
ncbi:MAG: helix-turn-helix domain-containing protein [Actinomycetota bacterium]